jgi:predicted DNA-binding ribbon-helix-helix protein
MISTKLAKLNMPKRSIIVAGHKTSVSLEEAFWEALREIAKERGSTLQVLITSINTERRHANLSSAIRLFVLGYYQNRNAPVPVETGRQVSIASDHQA